MQPPHRFFKLSTSTSLAQSFISNTSRRSFLTNAVVNSPASPTCAKPDSTPSASAKLFADAAAEESTPAIRSARVQQLENEHEVWTGEEAMQHAVLRMLVDKYKPLRTGVVVTADEKLKSSNRAAPLPVFNYVDPPRKPDTAKPRSPESWAATPLLPHIEGHRPWHSTYVSPSHSPLSVRTGNLPPPVRSTQTPVDGRERRKAREERKRSAAPGRLTRAKEATVDYKIGISAAKSGADAVQSHSQANPVSLKGWSSLVEDRIERARSAGLFNKLEGRGKPLAPLVSDTNPFIGREEYLMNRIVRRNGASPPWVDAQATLDTALANFRDILKQSLARRLVRELSAADNLIPSRFALTVEDVPKYRGYMVNWEKQNESYHNTALAEVNKLVQDYNCLAPYPVRRSRYSRSVELDKAYADCGPDVLRELEEIRLTRVRRVDSTAEGIRQGMASSTEHAGPSWFDVVRRWVDRWWR